jgi:hypothetical protein
MPVATGGSAVVTQSCPRWSKEVVAYRSRNQRFLRLFAGGDAPEQPQKEYRRAHSRAHRRKGSGVQPLSSQRIRRHVDRMIADEVCGPQVVAGLASAILMIDLVIESSRLSKVGAPDMLRSK